MRKPVRGWVFLDQDGELWNEMSLAVWDERIDGDMVPAAVLSLAPEDVEARRQAFEGCVEDYDPQDGIEVLIEAVERAWGLSPEADDG